MRTIIPLFWLLAPNALVATPFASPDTLFRWVLIAHADAVEIPGAMNVGTWACPPTELVASGVVCLIPGNGPPGTSTLDLSDGKNSFHLHEVISVDKGVRGLGPFELQQNMVVKEALQVKLDHTDGEVEGAQLDVGRWRDLLHAAVHARMRGTLDHPFIVRNDDGSALLLLPAFPKKVSGGGASSELRLMPNPANERVRVSGVKGASHWMLYDARSALVRTGTSAEGTDPFIEVRDLAPGHYVLQVQDGNGAQGLPLVVGP